MGAAEGLDVHYEVMNVLVHAVSLAEAASGVLAAIGQGFDWQHGTFWTVDRTTDLLRPAAQWRGSGAPHPVLEAATRDLALRRGEDLPGRVWQEVRTLYVEDVSTALAEPRRSAAGEIRLGALCFPVATPRGVCGVLEFLVGKVPPDDKLGPTFATLGRQIGQYLELVHAERKLCEAETRYREELEARVAERVLDLEREIQEHVCVETAAHHSEAKLRRLYESAGIGIVDSSFDGTVLQANDAFLRLIGATRAELEAGAINWRSITPAEWLPHDDHAVANLRSTGVIASYEKEFLNKQGERVAVVVGGALVNRDAGHAICFVLDNTARKRAERALAKLNQELEERVRTRTESLQRSEARAERAARALAASEQQLRALAAHLQTVREEERGQLAREIHDVLGQELTGLKMDVAWVARRLAERDTSRVASILGRLEAMGRHIDASIMAGRRIAAELRPGVLDDLGLFAALEWQAREFQSRFGVTVRITGLHQEPALDRGPATAVFRIFQELLTNVARHAQANTVYVSLDVTEERLRLEVRDDGRGISEAEASGSKSLGLLGMRERALAVGGTCTVGGVPGGGTIARIEIPLERR